MKTLKELIEARAALLDALKKVVTQAETEKRSLTADEAKDHEAKMAEVRSLDEQIKRRREFDAANASQAEIETEFRSPAAPKATVSLDDAKKGLAGEQPDEKRQAEIAKHFSFSKVLRHALGFAKLTGIEAELAEQDRRQANLLGIDYRGALIPSAVVGMVLRAAATAGGDGTGLQLVGTAHQPGIIQGVLPTGYILPQLGVTILDNLTANVEFGRETSSTAAAWVAETGSATELALATEKFTLSPKRVPTYTDYSTQLLRQTGPGLEAYVRRMSVGRILALIQKGVINGSGSSNQPTGILATTGIGSVAIGTNGGAPTWASMVNLEREVDLDEALMGSPVYLTNGAAKAKLKTVSRVSGQNGFIWADDNTINGYNALSTNSVPSDLDKGSSTGVCSAVLFGDFTQVILGQFGGIDVIVDNLTLAATGKVRIHHAAFVDVGMTRPQAIAACKDITTT